MKSQQVSKLHESSFRDNDGFIFETEGKLLRQVNKSYKSAYDLLMSGGLYQELVGNLLLIPHQEVSLDYAFTKEAYKVIEPQKLDFISYPYEWCFSQLKEAALLTLKVQNIALKFGMSLKDASAFNIQFVKGKPVLIDTLSFEKFQSTPWVAYRQFCQHFLNPLVLMSKIDPGLNHLLSIYLDGIPTELTAKLLPFWSKLNPTNFLHIQLHARMQKSHSQKKKNQPKPGSFSEKSMLGLISSLEAAISGLKLKQVNSFWSNYIPEYDSYTEDSFKHKKQIVTDLYNQTKSQMIWDLGANTGFFSRLVADLGSNVISFDYDPLSVEKNYLLSKDDPNILPLMIDWTNPSPNLGWADKERQSILDRGSPDCILALALIHHLTIGANIPLGKIAKLFSKLAPYLIIEFVPKEDPQVKEMLSLRKDIFADYHNSGFEKSFGKYFKVVKNIAIKGSLRRIYLMKSI